MKKLIVIIVLITSSLDVCSQTKTNFKNTDTLSIDIEKLDRKFLKTVRIREDKLLGVKRIYPKLRVNIYPYIFIYKNVAVLKFEASYSGSSWIFMDKLLINLKDELLLFNLNGISRNIVSGGVNETSDMFVDQKLRLLLESIKLSETPVIGRFVGDKSRTFQMSNKAIKSIKDLLLFYNTITEN